MSLRSLLHYARRELERIDGRKKISRLKQSFLFRPHSVELLEPRLLLTGNAPDALDDLRETSQDNAIVVAVLANDVLADTNSTLSIADFDQAAHGSVFKNEDSTLTYLPEVDFFGRDHFAYKVIDGSGQTDTREA